MAQRAENLFEISRKKTLVLDDHDPQHLLAPTVSLGHDQGRIATRDKFIELRKVFIIPSSGFEQFTCNPEILCSRLLRNQYPKFGSLVCQEDIMATQIESGTPRSHSSAWGSLILAPPKRYHSRRTIRRPNWEALRSIEDVTVCEDPPHWKSLAARSQRGEAKAFSLLLEEFSICLDMFFMRIMNDDASDTAVGETLKSVASKLHTCDTNHPILPWLLAIAKYRAEHPIVSAMKH
jgi:hypothetical protein